MFDFHPSLLTPLVSACEYDFCFFNRHQFRQEEGQKRKKKREPGTEGSKRAKPTEQTTQSDNT